MDKTAQTPVSADRYDDEWVSCAWGEDNAAELMQDGQLSPRPRVARAVELCQLRAGDKLLDIACGRGELPAIVAEKGLHAVGVDYSFTVLSIARKVKKHRKEIAESDFDMHIVQSDACTLPFPDESFDRITMLDIVEHLTPQQLEKMFLEVKRLLKSDGFAVVHTLPNRWVYDIGYKVFRHLNRKLPEEPRSEIEKQVHINEQDIVGLAKLLRKCGLDHSLWLEQQIPAQARWQSSKSLLSDNRGQLYPMMAGNWGRCLEILSMTPLKLILCNDIFAVLWKGAAVENTINKPWSLTEKFACWLGRH